MIMPIVNGLVKTFHIATHIDSLTLQYGNNLKLTYIYGLLIFLNNSFSDAKLKLLNSMHDFS